MPLSSTIDAAKRLLLVTGSGRLHPEEIEAQRQLVADDARMQPGMRILLDFRAVAAFELGGRELFSLAHARQQFPILSPAKRTAIVVSDATGLALARKYVLSRRPGSEPVAVFEHMDEAAQWLALDPPEIDCAGGA